MTKVMKYFETFLVILCLQSVSSELIRDRPSISRPSIINKFNASDAQTDDAVKDAIDDRLNQHIYAMIEHFKDPDPVGLPLPIPDPLEAADIPEHSFTGGKIAMANVKVAGISKFRLVRSEVKLDQNFKGFSLVTFESLTITGNYTLKALFQTKSGPFTIIMKEVRVEAGASFVTDRKGRLRTEDIVANVDIGDKSFEFVNAGMLNSIIKSILDNESLFNIIKEQVIQKSKATIKMIIDEKIDDTLAPIGLLPNSIGPVDFAIAEGRKFIRNGYDPLKVNDFEKLGLVGYRIHDTELNGLSTIYRIGDIAVRIENGIAVANVEIGTGELFGHTFWETSLARGMITRGGKLRFVVKHLKIYVRVKQPVDLRKKLVIDDLQLDLGNIQVSSDGLGTLDYLVEFFINVVPNILRYQLIDALERPIIYRIHEFTNQQVPEQVIKEKLTEYIESSAMSFDVLRKKEL